MVTEIPKRASVVYPTNPLQQSTSFRRGGHALLFVQVSLTQVVVAYTVPTVTTFVIGNGAVPITDQQNPNVSTKVSPTVTPGNADVNICSPALQQDSILRFSGQGLSAKQSVQSVQELLNAVLEPVTSKLV